MVGMDESEENGLTVAPTVAAGEAVVAPRIEIVGELRRTHDAALWARVAAGSLKLGVRVGAPRGGMTSLPA